MSALAGISTGIGSVIAFFAKRTNEKFLSVSLGFSAGVMIYASMIEIFFKAKKALVVPYGDKIGLLITIAAFFSGMLVIWAIEKLLPEKDAATGIDNRDDRKSKLMRTGFYTALAIGIHNFPEGLATFISALRDPKLAIPIVFAIAIHNIPEGIAVSVPIYFSTGSKKKAFIYSFLSGLAEPLGAIIGYLALKSFMNDTVYGFLFACVAGIMVYISFDELLPASRECKKPILSTYGLCGGMLTMAISLWLFV